MTRKFLLIFSSLAHIVLIMGLLRTAASAATFDGDEVAANIGSLQIKIRDIQNLLDAQSSSPSATTMSSLNKAVHQEALRKLLLVKAKEAKLDSDPEVKNRIKLAAEQALVNAYLEKQSQLPSDYPSEELTKSIYAKNTATFTVPASVHLMQIFSAVAADASMAKIDAIKANLVTLAERARNSNATFSDLAQSHSEDDESAHQGGDMGWIRIDQLQPEFYAALKNLKPGEISVPVRGSTGWHLFKLVERKDAQLMSFESAHNSIVQALRRKAMQDSQLAYIRKLLAENPVAVDEIALSKLLQAKKQ